MIVKSGRNEIELTTSDVVMDNGACVQILASSGAFNAVISKTNWKKYLPHMELVKIEKMEKFDLKYYKLK